MARAAGIPTTSQNRIDSFVLMHFYWSEKFDISLELADRIFVDGGELEEEFGSKFCNIREIIGWSEEWVVDLELQKVLTLKEHVWKKMVSKMTRKGD